MLTISRIPKIGVLLQRVAWLLPGELLLLLLLLLLLELGFLLSQDRLIPGFIITNPCITIHTYYINPLKPNDPYMGRTAQLTSRRCISRIYSINIRTVYFKNAAQTPFFLFKMPFIS